MNQFAKITWRLIRTPPASGAWNMAVDEAILEAVLQGLSPPTLRLYAWNPPCLSLGYAQPFADVNQEQLQSHGWDLVRRPTGGRSILHTDELTYAVIGLQSDPRLSGSVLESYRNLSQALLKVLHLLAIPATIKGKRSSNNKDRNGIQKSPIKNPVCFEVPSDYEIVCNGKKLIGSAQARRKEGVLQHGSLPLGGDLTHIIDALQFPDPATRSKAEQRLLARATTAEQILGYELEWQTAAAAFEKAFAEVLDLQLENSELTTNEYNRTEILVEEKFANPDWTLRI
ncbi:MAG: lipoate--protein ligase family protein [Chloroflexota bacterium]|nr:lipoate--protein ligase family protein [Chloroflexota bacterium]